MSETQPKSTVWSKIRRYLQLPKYYLIAFLLMVLGQELGVLMVENPLADALFQQSPAGITASFYLVFVPVWLVIILYMGLRKKDRPIFRALGARASGNNGKGLLIGLLIGGGLNAFCALAALLNGDIALYFDSFHPISFLLIFVCVFIQSSSEELLCRGYLYQKLLRTYKKPVIAIAGNALFFGLLHLGNQGVTVLSIVNIVVVGVFFSLMVYYMDSIWCAMAAHAAWNFFQNIVVGLPNSGNVVPYSVWKLDAASATDSFVYNVGFGIEGTLLADTVLIIGCVVLYLWGRKHGRKPIDIWQEAAE